MASQPLPPAPYTPSVHSVIDRGLRVYGNVTALDGLRIDGEVQGSVRARNVACGKTGVLKGDMIAESVLIEGYVEGSIQAASVHIRAGSTVLADILHGLLVIEEGAMFEGRCTRMGAEENMQRASALVADNL